jgi:hypothetical protein
MRLYFLDKPNELVKTFGDATCQLLPAVCIEHLLEFKNFVSCAVLTRRRFSIERSILLAELDALRSNLG